LEPALSGLNKARPCRQFARKSRAKQSHPHNASPFPCRKQMSRVASSVVGETPALPSRPAPPYHACVRVPNLPAVFWLSSSARWFVYCFSQRILLLLHAAQALI
jgi:hypothetical protein